MAWEDVQLGSPAAGEVHVRHRAVGVNYIDIAVRRQVSEGRESGNIATHADTAGLAPTPIHGAD